MHVPVAVRISPHHMSKEDYTRLIAELKASGVDEPTGRLSHMAYGDDEVRMFETWESAEHFAAHRDDLFAALQSVGLGAGCVEVHALHSPRPD
jgi:quinol monooxygenase YgiN